MQKKRGTSIDPELERQLAAARDDEAVEAAFSLRAPDDNPLIEPAEVRNTVDQIVQAAQDRTGQKVHDLNVLPRAQQFVLAAPPKVVREVLKSSKIASALANKQPESLAIDPVESARTKPPPRRRGGGKPKR